MSNTPQPLLCPKCKGTGNGKYKMNDFGNMEADICDECRGVGFLASDAAVQDQRTHLSSMASEIESDILNTTNTTGRYTEELSIRKLKETLRTLQRFTDKEAVYAIIDLEDNNKIYCIPRGSLQREFLDFMISKKGVIHTDFGNVNIVPKGETE